MRMKGTTIGGKAAAGANAILRAVASGVKSFLHPITKSVEYRISLGLFLRPSAVPTDYQPGKGAKVAVSSM
jgi:hypothetical protein